MQELAFLSVWPCEDGIVAVQLRLRVHQAAAQRGAFLFAACQEEKPPSERPSKACVTAHPYLYLDMRQGRPGILQEGQVGGGSGLPRRVQRATVWR